ncbi:MAG: GIN domain-containing protein [Bacteroidia bacterium]
MLKSVLTSGKWLSFLFLLLILSGCKKENLCDCIKSTGNDVTSDRPASPFNTIQLEGKIDLVLTQDTIEHITVVAGKHLIDNIETSISGSTLLIRNHNMCNFVRSYGRRITVYASVHRFSHLLYNGAGDVRSTNTLLALGSDSTLYIQSDDGSGNVNLNVNAKILNSTINTGPGNITLTGMASTMNLRGTGFGVLNTTGLTCPHINLTNDAVSDMYVAINTPAASYLNAQVYNNGNVYCKGRPSTLIQVVKGNGKLYFQ